MNANGTGWLNLGVTCGEIVYDHDDNAQWSPDGTRILTSHNYNLYTLSPGGGNLTKLTFDGTASEPIGVGRWSRQGTKISYIKDTYDTPRLYIMSADGASKETSDPGNHKGLRIQLGVLRIPGHRKRKRPGTLRGVATIGQRVNQLSGQNYQR
jgi:hypothetical protein